MMNISESNPCKDCNDRYLACHDYCIKYKDWRDNLDKYNNHVKEVNNLEYSAYVSNLRKRER